jgi:hypothetical protein
MAAKVRNTDQQIAAASDRMLPVSLPRKRKAGFFPAFLFARLSIEDRMGPGPLWSDAQGSQSIGTWPGSLSTRFSQAPTAG